MIIQCTAKAENNTNANFLEAELFLITFDYEIKHFLSDVTKTTFAAFLSSTKHASISQRFCRLFAITEVLRKNFTTNISSKNTLCRTRGTYSSMGTYCIRLNTVLGFLKRLLVITKY